MPTERIAKVNPDEIGRPKGAYRIELLDRHTGRVKERVEQSNYLSPAHDRMVAWTQGSQFHHGQRYVHLGNAGNNWPSRNNGEFATENRLSSRDYAIPPAFPTEFIVGTTSTRPEVTTDEWPTGDITGYGSRWKTTAIPAAGARGQINEAQSELGLDSVKLVWDFNENQGNGTTSSLQIARLARVDPNPPAFALTNDAGEASFEIRAGSAGSHTFDPRGDIDTPGTWYYALYLGWGADGPMFLDLSGGEIVYYDPLNWTTNPDTGRTSPDAGTAGTTLTSLPASTTGTSSGPTWWNSSNYCAGAYDATRIFLFYCDGHDSIQAGVWNRSTGALVSRSEVIDSGDAVEHNDVVHLGATIIGDEAFFTFYETSHTGVGADSYYKIWRYNLTTYTLTASFPLGTDPLGDPISMASSTLNGQITNDGVDLLVSTSVGVVRYSTAGVKLDVLGYPNVSQINETGIAPWNPSYQNVDNAGYPRDTMVRFFAADNYTDRRNGGPYTTAPAALITGMYRTGGVSIAVHAGKLYAFAIGTFSDQKLSPDSVAGTLYSRSALDVSIVKTASSTMKWTYELTLPSEWRGELGHTTIPPAP